jgi:hypothetical protein
LDSKAGPHLLALSKPKSEINADINPLQSITRMIDLDFAAAGQRGHF